MPRLLELFSGTGSVGRAFGLRGWDVVSLDLERKFRSTYCGNIRDFCYRSLFVPGEFDFVWASPPCTEYSRARTTASTERDLDGADELVGKALEIIGYLQPRGWAMENPQTGLLKDRAVVAGLPFLDVTYCKFGYPYKKPTRIWTNIPELFSLPSPCSAGSPCADYARSGNHPSTAQRAPGRRDGQRLSEDKHSLEQLYSMPPKLCDKIAEAASRCLVYR